MKVIGRVEEGQTSNGEYTGGAIVLLKPQEVKALAFLQGVWNGKVFRFDPRRYDVQEEDVEGVFNAVRAFAEAKLAINEFRETIDRLDNMLIKSGDNEL